MSPSARRGVGAIGVVVFAAFYIWLAITIGDFVPDVWWMKLIYFAVIGTAWAIPLKPLIAWAEGGSGRCPSSTEAAASLSSRALRIELAANPRTNSN